MEYIYDTIIRPLNDYLYEDRELEWWQWKDMKEDVERCSSTGQMPYLHNAMVPLYELYWNGDEQLYNPHKYKALEIVKAAIELDGDFISWASQYNLMTLTEDWIQNGSVMKYMDVLEMIVGSAYETDWHTLYDGINEKILQLEVTGESMSGEFYCILHGFVMIMTGVEDEYDQAELFHKLRRHWSFLRHLYSIMVRRIVGFNFNNFVGVINNAKVSPSCTPYLNILYNAIQERSQDLIRLGAKQKNLDKAVGYIEELINKTDQNTDLDRLCEVLFPDEIRDMLNTHRLPSYQQLKQENGQLKQKQQELLSLMKEQTRQTNEQISKMADAIKQAIEAAIPVKDIEKELMELPAGTAWEIFQTLNELFEDHDTWRKYDRDIRKKLKERMKATEKRNVVQNNYNLELVQNKGVNIGTNYGPNIDNHDGGTVGLPSAGAVPDSLPQTGGDKEQ